MHERGDMAYERFSKSTDILCRRCVGSTIQCGIQFLPKKKRDKKIREKIMNILAGKTKSCTRDFKIKKFVIGPSG